MLGKLFITSNSACQKLQSTYDLVIEAAENKIAPDAASRTSLTKLQSALNKALGEIGKSTKDVTNSVTSTAAIGSPAAVEERYEPMTLGEKDVKQEPTEMEASAEGHDSLLEELLNDEDDNIE